MIGRLVRALLRRSSGSVPSVEAEAAPPALPVTAAPWKPGDLAQCITSDWVGTAPAAIGFPREGRLYRVERAVIVFVPMVGARLTMMRFESMPGDYAASGFDKVEPDLTPALPTFTADLWHVRQRVKARQGET